MQNTHGRFSHDSEHQVSNFIRNIRTLFLDERCLHVEETYTSFAIRSLSRPKFWVLGAKPMSIGATGGPDPNDVAACLGRMKSWVVLAIQTTRAEFPGFDVVRCFDAFFAVGPASSSSKWAPDEDHLRKSCSRLAKAFGVDARELLNQVKDCLPIVRQTRARLGCSAVRAWQDSLRHMRSRPSLKARRPSEALRACLVRYVGWGGTSTSGIEQMFGKLQLKISQCRDASESVEVTVRKLLVDVRDDERQESIKAAQWIWVETYGASRKTSTHSLATGQSHVTNKITLIGWLRQRRTAVSRASQGSETGAVEKPKLGTHWQASHEKEWSFQ